MIVVITRYKVKEGTRDKVLDFAKVSRTFARTQKGNLEYAAMPAPEADEIIALEKWETKEDLLAYCATDVCKNFVENRAPYIIDSTKVTDILDASAISL